MTFDHLSDREFEEFTYDLLVEMGFVNVDWRRGTGKPGASADQGRDIVADLRRQEIDGAEHLEHWFVQCKHYKRGVPPDTLSAATTWASAERPAVLLFVVSNFLSNPAKTWLDDYESNNKPSFRFKRWERKDLERLMQSRPELAAKYRLEVGNGPQNVHPAHLQYVLRPSFNTLKFFFATLDRLDDAVRDELFSFAYYWLVNPKRRGHEGDTGEDSVIDEVTYTSFQLRCREVAQLGVAEHFIVEAILCHTLHWAWGRGDPTQLASKQSRDRDTIAFFTKYPLPERISEPDQARLSAALTLLEEHMSSAPDAQQTWAGHYRILCEDVLPALELQEYLWSGEIGLDELLQRAALWMSEPNDPATEESPTP